MCLLRSRVRLPNSAGRRLAENASGDSGGGTSGFLSRQERENPGGEALTAVHLLHRVSAGPMAARTRCPTGVLGEGFDSYVDIHHHQARRRRGRCPGSVLRDWVGGRRTCRRGNDERVGPRRQVREWRQMEDQHRQRFLRWPAVRRRYLEGTRRENVRQPGQPGNQGRTDRDRPSSAGRPRCGCLADLRPTCGTDQVERQSGRPGDAVHQSWSFHIDEGERLGEEDRQEGGFKEVQC
jgi:hypothetical protein